MFLKIDSLSSLLRIQNGLGEAVCKRELGRIVADLNEGPDLDKARTLNFKVEFVPIADRMNNLCEVKVTFSATSRLVTMRSRELSMRVTDDGQTLLFNDESPGSIDQLTLDDEARKQKDRDKGKDK